MRHYRRTALKTRARNLNEKMDGNIACSLCQAVEDWQLLKETETMRLIKNRAPYDVFDGIPTTGRHYLVVPKRHVSRINELSDKEKLEMMNALAEYEAQGFTIFSQTMNSINRTQEHLHTHLIELSQQRFHFLFYLAKPYLLITNKRKRSER